MGLMMRLDEIKKFDSTVYNILEKTVDKGIDVNIDLTLPGMTSFQHGKQDVEKYGEIAETNYWSTENIVNIVYMVKDAAGIRQQRDWRYRPLTGQMFDEAFTIKKVDGVLTFMQREKQDD